MSLDYLQERRQRWLSLLIEAYELIDEGVSLSIRYQEATAKKQLACRKGCFHCCRTHRDIPVYPHEITGIYWYVLEGMPGSLREILKLQLLIHEKGSPCPFLIDTLCSIHPFRPSACRQFNVFTKPCSPGEDPYYTRKEDLLIPDRSYLQRAFLKVLPFYGLGSAKDPEVAEAFIRSQALILQDIDWRPLGRRIP